LVERTGARWLAVAAEVVLAVLLGVGVFVSGTFFPVLGAGLTLLAPLPFVALRLRHGPSAQGLALALAAVSLAVPLSTAQALAFLLEFGVPAILLAEGLQRARRPEVLVTGVAVVLTVGGLGVLLLSSGQWAHPLDAIQQQVGGLLADMETLSVRVGGPKDAAVLPGKSVAALRAFLLMAFPGLFFTGSLLTAAGYVVLLQALVRRWPAQLGGLAPGAFRWQLPEVLVWVFIGAGALFLTGFPGWKALGLNGLIILVGLYFLQGMCIVAFFFQRFQLPRFLATLSVVLLVLQPFFTLLVAALGLFDVWFAFRRLNLPRASGRT
jgi:uncharacterized protein YybS (DUF2232 family)